MLFCWPSNLLILSFMHIVKNIVPYSWTFKKTTVLAIALYNLEMRPCCKLHIIMLERRCVKDDTMFDCYNFDERIGSSWQWWYTILTAAKWSTWYTVNASFHYSVYIECCRQKLRGKNHTLSIQTLMTSFPSTISTHWLV